MSRAAKVAKPRGERKPSVPPQEAIAYRDALRRMRQMGPVGSMMPWTSSIDKAVANLPLPSGEWVMRP